MIELTSKVKSGRLPLINGILLADGTFYQTILSQSGRKEFSLEQHEKKVIDFRSIEWVEFDVLTEMILPDKIILKSGEGALGGDGFIYMENSGNIEWIIFFENSNPLMITNVDNGHVIVESDLGLKISIILATPNVVAVI